jgi:hypothetical protein
MYLLNVFSHSTKAALIPEMESVLDKWLSPAVCSYVSSNMAKVAAITGNCLEESISDLVIRCIMKLIRACLSDGGFPLLSRLFCSFRAFLPHNRLIAQLSTEIAEILNSHPEIPAMASAAGWTTEIVHFIDLIDRPYTMASPISARWYAHGPEDPPADLTGLFAIARSLLAANPDSSLLPILSHAQTFLRGGFMSEPFLALVCDLWTRKVIDFSVVLSILRENADGLKSSSFCVVFPAVVANASEQEAEALMDAFSQNSAFHEAISLSGFPTRPS